MDGDVRAVLRVAHLYPELLGTYGDGGNALVLATRARRRGVAVDVIEVTLDDPIPDAEIYLLGGGEDGPQRQATYALAKDRALARRVDDGAVVLGVCAGFQILGNSYDVEGDISVDGLGLIDAVTTRGPKRRVGDLLTRVGSKWIVGFENHGGQTALGDGVAPLGIVEEGFGNGVLMGDNGRHVDGARQGRLYATYAHGPVLAQNPWLADELLSVALSRDLEPLETIADQLHRARVESVGDFHGGAFSN